MADDSDVPPLEDMTEVLKQADTVRQGRLTTSFDDKLATNAKDAKQRAKVKKNVGARSVRPENVGDGDGTNNLKPESKPQSEEKISSQPKTVPQSSSCTTAKPKSTAATSGGMFGGLKKGFLFGGSSKPASSTNSAPTKAKTDNKTKVSSGVQKESKEVKSRKEDIPFISPSTGKTESGLTMSEVQQAMSEAKGLLQGDEWVTDDLLNKVEKNDVLLKRFADPHFMKALQEFQTNPEAAMEKYKGNKEVEKFLLEFCGLLGDHFTNVGEKSESGGAATSSATATKPAKSSKTTSKITEQPKSQNPKPKIIEIQDSEDNAASTVPLNDKNKQGTTENDNSSAKITEINNSLASSDPSDKITMLNTPQNLSDKKEKGPVIQTRNPNLQADIQELPQAQDAEVKEILNDPKVMEILLDPKVMNLIETLRENPAKAQRLVDGADRDLKEKIGFLVSRGLLQFQSE